MKSALHSAGLTALVGAPQSMIPSGLVAFWDFSEAAGGPYISKTKGGYALQVTNGTPTAETSGPFGSGVGLSTTSSLHVPFADVGRLNMATSQECTVIAYVSRVPTTTLLAMIAGRWEETGSNRQYALFHHVALYAGTRRVYGHVSSTGGATPGGWDFATDGSATTRKTSAASRMHMMGMTYSLGDEQAVSYLDGVADSFPTATITQASPPLEFTSPRNPYPYDEGLYASSTAPFRVGAANGSNLNSWNGTIGALYVFDRKLNPSEMMQVHLATIPPEWPIFRHEIFEESGQTAVRPDRLGFVAYTGTTATDGTTATSPWSTATPTSLADAQGFLTCTGSSANPAAAYYRFIGTGGGVPMDSIGSLSVRVNHASSNTGCRLLIEVDNSALYATDAALADHVGASNIVWSGSTQQDIAFSRAAANWRSVTINPGVELSMAGTTLGADITGSRITGIGAYVPSRAGSVRFTDLGIWKP